MHGARDAVMQLNVELRKLVILNDASVAQIPQAGLVYHVADSKTLDRLILRGLRGAPIAEHLARVVTPVAVTPVIAPLDLDFEQPRQN